MARRKSPESSEDLQSPPAAADLARALRDPLEDLLAMGELMNRQALSAPAREQLQAMLLSARRMGRLLDDSVAADARDAEDAQEVVCLRDLIDNVERHWQAQRPEAADKLLISCAFANDLLVMADPQRVGKFLNMLIEDAFASGPRGVIDVQISAGDAHGGTVSITGRLNAFKAMTSRSDARLAHCKAAARRLDGDVYKIDQPGAGEQIGFDLRLALADETQIGVGEAEEGPMPPGTHLLIVDDNATNRMVAAALCAMFGCTTETAEDGLEAVQAVRSRPFDLILMDIKMPKMDGIQATKAIRALSGAASKTPIVALTANADPEAVATYLACGMVDVVDKPIKPAQLLSALQTALRGKEAGSAVHASAA
jgi:CheY-like chemotaxis protein